MNQAHPKLPFVARTLMPREVQVNGLLAVTLGVLEGGLLGVIVKTGFNGVADVALVNLAVAVVTGAPALANVASLWFAQRAYGRNKSRLVALLMGMTALAATALAWMPVSAAGLIGLTLVMVMGRLCFAGVITLRAAIWRANFPRHVRATITGRIAVIYSIIMGLTAGGVGFAMQSSDTAWRLLFPVAGLMGLIAAWRYRRFTVRGQGRLLRQEAAEGGSGPIRWSDVVAVFRNDRWYRRYMMTMFIFGSGNLMVIALLVVILTEQVGLSQFKQVMITTTIPLLAVALLTPLWARSLDQVHILVYRAWHSWMFVITMVLFLFGAALRAEWLFWLGALAMGAAFAGGKLGWNLGHNDFASDGQSTLYMGIHVSLTGVRGLIAPLLGVFLYQWLQGLTPGLGRYVLVFPFLMTLTGAITFVVMARKYRREQGLPPVE
ncbi:MAG: MFS transporter [Pseudomonadota bacterium]